MNSNTFHIEYNITSATTTTTTLIPLNSTKLCSIALQYKFLEHIIYLYFMSPLCLI
ncbi:unnamed protein product, partial [Adineta ricciae]